MTRKERLKAQQREETHKLGLEKMHSFHFIEYQFEKPVLNTKNVLIEVCNGVNQDKRRLMYALQNYDAYVGRKKKFQIH